jgi:hypothetical protein
MASTDMSDSACAQYVPQEVTLGDACNSFSRLGYCNWYKDSAKDFRENFNWEEECEEWDEIKNTPGVDWKDPDTIPISILREHGPFHDYVDLRVLKHYFDNATGI